VSAIPLAQTARLRTGRKALFPCRWARWRLDARVFPFESASLGVHFPEAAAITKLRFVGMVAIWQRSRYPRDSYKQLNILWNIEFNQPVA
jgi:hypothetical protein